MTHTKHTPGPWVLKRFDECQTIVIGENMTLAIVSVGEGRPNGEANARLIAATPGLLEALRPLAEMDCESWGCSHLEDEESNECEPRDARIAIAKAEGTP